MGVNILDGPGAGNIWDSRVAPTFLRVVRHKETDKWDLLNYREDVAADEEEIFAYRMIPGTWKQVFVRPGGEYQSGDYLLIELQPDDATMRSNEKWREYVYDTLRSEGVDVDARKKVE